MTKIRIIGGAGSGKTTLSKKLTELLCLPNISLDHSAKRVKKLPLEKGQALIERKSAADNWVIEGVQYSPQYASTFQQADVIIFLDIPLWIRQKRLIKRYLELKFELTESSRNCSLTQLVRLLRWNHYFNRETNQLKKELKTHKTNYIKITNKTDLKQVIEAFRKAVNREELEEMDLTKLNFFNRKAGEKYKYEYNYDEDYDYDYDYDYDVIIPAAKQQEAVASIPELKEEKVSPAVSSDTKALLEEENAQLKQEISEQNEYIKKLMLIKKKSDSALDQLREHVESFKANSDKLREQLIKSEEEKEKLKESLEKLKEKNDHHPTEKAPVKPNHDSVNVKDQSEFNTVLLVKHLKLNQETTKKLENRLNQVESELAKLESTSKTTVVRKRSSK